MPNSRGSAFVAFSSADEATRAVTEMNGKMAGTKPLYVALAQRKEDRRMRLQAQFAQRAVASGGMPGQRGRGGRGGAQGGRGARGQNMRGFNQNMPPAPPAPNMPPAPEAPMSAVEQLAAQLPNASADQQRMLLGEALYPLVDAVEPASSAKITGMLLEMDQSEVLHLIEDSKALSDKVQEAVTVLKAAAAEDA